MRLVELGNATLAVLRRLARGPFIRRPAERAMALSYFQKLRIRASAIEQPAAGLSGGNQQKIVLAKWLEGGDPCPDRQARLQR